MAAPRAYWKGHLRLSLVSIGVEIYTATDRTSALTMHQIHKSSGKRVRYEKVVPGIGPVENDEIVKGYEIDDGNYVILEPEELDEIKLETSRTIELVQFVEGSDIDPRYFERPYYMVPDDDVSNEGFVVIREALRRSGKIGVGQLTLRGREYLVTVSPCGAGLLLETLRYADELRATEPFFRDIPAIKPEKELIDLANELIERKSAPFDASAFSDSYAVALSELIERKRKGKAIVSTGEEKGPPRGAEVVDLMEALKKSVRSGKGREKDKGGKSDTGASGRKSSGGRGSRSRQRKAG